MAVMITVSITDASNMISNYITVELDSNMTTAFENSIYVVGKVLLGIMNTCASISKRFMI